MSEPKKGKWSVALASMREHAEYLRSDLNVTTQVVRASLSDMRTNFNSIHPVFIGLVSLVFWTNEPNACSEQFKPVVNLARSKDFSPLTRAYNKLNEENPLIVREIKTKGSLIFFLTSVSLNSPFIRPMRGLMFMLLYTFWTIETVYPMAIQKALMDLFRKNQNS